MTPSLQPRRLASDYDVVWKPKHIFIPAISFTGVTTAAINEGGAGNFAAGETWAGVHTGVPISKEISTFGVAGILVDTAADEVNHYMMMPGDMDLSKRIYARVHWTSGSIDTADTVTWKVWYFPLIYNVTAIKAIGNTAGTALNKVIAADDVPVATAYAWAVTEYGWIDPNTLPETTEAILWSVEFDAFDAGLSEDKFLLGLEIMYTPKVLANPGVMPHEAKRPTYMLGKSTS